MAKNPSHNALIVVQGHDDPRLYASRVETGAMHWIEGSPPAAGKPLSVMTRYRMKPAACRIGLANERSCRLDFAQPQWAPTPGQYAVVYDAEICLGGAVIERSLTSVATETTHPETV
jgi:tRNA-specific 2-thiouridylase